MIEESARVQRCEGEFAWVETQRKSSCGSCGARKGCGTGALSQVFGRRMQSLKVHNPIAAQPGDAVVLGIEEGVLLKGSVAVYLLPLLTLIGGGLLGQALAPQWLLDPEWFSMILAILGLFGGLWWLCRFNRHAADDPRYMATILRIEKNDFPIDISGLSGK